MTTKAKVILAFFCQKSYPLSRGQHALDDPKLKKEHTQIPIIYEYVIDTDRLKNHIVTVTLQGHTRSKVMVSNERLYACPYL